MSEPTNEESKLIIDEDWKTQVQREKEQLKNKNANEDEPTGAKIMEPSESVPEADSSEKHQPLPPATFELLVSSMATQAVAAMGQLPGDDGQPFPKRLDFAKHYIDLLDVIEAKTKGNLEAGEENFLRNTLHQLRMIFVSASK